MRFESTLYFGNVERFRNMLVDITGQDPSIQQEPQKEVKVAEGADSSENAILIDNEVDEGYSNYGAVVPNRVSRNYNQSTSRVTGIFEMKFTCQFQTSPTRFQSSHRNFPSLLTVS